MVKNAKVRVLWTLAFSSATIWTFLLLTWKNEWKDSIDNFSDAFVRSKISLAAFLLVLSIISLLYLMILASCFSFKRDYWISKTSIFIMFVIFLFSASLISAEVAVGRGNFFTTRRCFEYIFPIAQLVLVLGAVFAIIPFLHCVEKSEKKFMYWVVALAYFGLLVSPLIFHSSHIIPTKEIPKKPLLIGHRGLKTLAPENTVSSFKLAEKHLVWGIEGDIQISKDGIPFMMHDSTLLRTTNVEKVFPKRSFDKAANFYWNELMFLDAGSWFSKDYIGEKIPSLKDILEFLKSKPNLKFIFDLKMPPKDHPYYSSFKDTIVEIIKNSDTSHQILWLFSLNTFFDSNLREQEIQLIKTQLPRAQLVAPATFRLHEQPTLSAIEQGNFSYINTFQGIGNGLLDSYIQSSSVNTWTVNEDWLFGQMWLNGVHSVTTNHPQRFAPMTSPPTWYLTNKHYFILWSLLIVYRFLEYLFKFCGL